MNPSFRENIHFLSHESSEVIFLCKLSVYFILLSLSYTLSPEAPRKAFGNEIPDFSLSTFCRQIDDFEVI